MLKLRHIPYIGALGILVYMPFHIFLSQWLSTYTGGLEIWKIAKDVVLLALTMFAICLVFWQGKADKIFKFLLFFTFAYGLLHLGTWAFNTDIYGRSALLGLVYNMRLPLFLILGYGTIKLMPQFVLSSVIKVILVVSTVVAGLGIVQYFLPADTLQHFGYSIARGARPAFFIDDNQAFLRIMSTLREPNALAAYLILPATALTLLVCRAKEMRQRLLCASALVIQVLAIGLTFSRSAWLGLALSVAIALGWQYRQKTAAILKRFWPVLAVAVLVLAVGVFTARNTYVFQHYITHYDPTEKVQDLDSNDYHLLYIQQGLEGIVRKPMGHGPGTAGLASIQNPDGGQLTENYYIQIGYEVGIIGLALFVALNIGVYVVLWRRGDIYGVILCASFWGYVVTNMLLHTWSNETVAAQWWLFAGMAMAAGSTLYPKKDAEKHRKSQASK